MTAHVVTSACEHSRRVVRTPLCDACELAPIEAAPAPARTDCETCGGARHIRKMWTTIPCPDCNDIRPSCAYCGGTMVMRDGRSCDGGACAARRRVQR